MGNLIGLVMLSEGKNNKTYTSSVLLIGHNETDIERVKSNAEKHCDLVVVGGMGDVVVDTPVAKGKDSHNA
jgi:hypothetical protein